MKATRQPGEKGQALTWRTVVKRAAPVALALVAFYLVLPRVTAVLGAWPSLSALNPAWFGAAVAAEGLSLSCAFALQRLALGTSKWYAVITSGLTGNAITNAMPGGDAVGAAVQFRMLGKAGIDADAAVSGLGTFSFLQVGGLLALPIFSIPAILFGTPVPRGLLDSALLGIAGFALFAGCSVLLLRTSRPLELFGRGTQWLWNSISRRKPPLTGLDHRGRPAGDPRLQDYLVLATNTRRTTDLFHVPPPLRAARPGSPTAGRLTIENQGTQASRFTRSRNGTVPALMVNPGRRPYGVTSPGCDVRRSRSPSSGSRRRARHRPTARPLGLGACLLLRPGR